MKKLFCLMSCILFMFFLFTDGYAAENSFKTDKDINNYMMHYFQSPQPDRILDAISYLANSEDMQKKSRSQPLVVFFSVLLQRDPALSKQVFEKMNQKGSELEMKFLASILESRVAQDLAKADPKSPADLDYLWSLFFATGEEWPIKKIISVLHFNNKESGIENRLLGGAAQWSLEANAKSFQKVLAICKNELSLAAGVTQTKLNEIISRVEKL